MIYKSWKADVIFLMYFGFLRGTFSKTLFMLFCACMTFPIVEPNEGQNKLVYRLNTVLSFGLCLASLTQILKFFNKDEESDRLKKEGAAVEHMKQPIF